MLQPFYSDTVCLPTAHTKTNQITLNIFSKTFFYLSDVPALVENVI